ncbi:AI-2E family transporter [Alicyclobacillus herbarius]|uniref:AI-2E family transporter n=1 Tax=Alicyclobacillus herbarius TaxID=122960 RepID=UPI000414708A|nr:AI-2E family transporter [Alicyclobacillus herbarius]
MRVTDGYLRFVVAVFVTLLCLYLIGQLRAFFGDIWAVIKVVLIPFLAALIISYVLQPIVELLVRRRVPRTAAIALIYIAFILLVAVLVVNCIPLVSQQINQLMVHLPGLVKRVDTWLDNLSVHTRYLPDTLRKTVESATAHLEQRVNAWLTRLISGLSGTVNAIFVAFTIPFLVFYMLKDARAIGRAMVRLFPAQHRDEVRHILTGIDDTLGRYVRGQLLVMVVVGILTYAGLLIVHMPYALLLALLMALMDLVPYIGPFLGATPAVLLAFAISPQMALKVILVNAAVQQLEGNLISPQIMGRTLDLHPMLIVAAILIGGEIGGMLGLIAAVPLVAVIKVAWQHIREYRNHTPPSG